MKRCSSVSRLSSCSPKRVLAGRVRGGLERSCTVGRSWHRTRCFVNTESNLPLDADVPGSLGCLWPGGGGLRLREGTFTFHRMSFSV